jgi:hypothetical protein
VKVGFYNNQPQGAESRRRRPGSINSARTRATARHDVRLLERGGGVFNSMTQLAVHGGQLRLEQHRGLHPGQLEGKQETHGDAGIRFVRQQPHDGLGQSSNFLPDKFVLSQAPSLYLAGCAVAQAPGAACPTASRQALNPLNGQLQGPGSVLLIGQLVPNSGNGMNGIFKAGEGIEYTAYTWPLIAPAPRVGFAYDMSGKQTFVIRGGMGLFFDRPNGNSIYGLVANPPNAYSVTANFGQLQQLACGGLSVQGARRSTRA